MRPCPNPDLLLQLATDEAAEALLQYALAEAHFSITHPSVVATCVRVESALAFEAWAKSLQSLQEAA